ncbi:hypothetical protein L798_13319 [Zootermopsis nevadensis]|uniref:Uncharacterized protein n=1 Tax=Zootermopsis nevadensis TaxID=136037 RepID=A0A067QSL2_ZOONE|nr:hypothetical protein L798_13319 [Zootermopsis nevadensis]
MVRKINHGKRGMPRSLWTPQTKPTPSLQIPHTRSCHNPLKQVENQTKRIIQLFIPNESQTLQIQDIKTPSIYSLSKIQCSLMTHKPILQDTLSTNLPDTLDNSLPSSKIEHNIVCTKLNTIFR